ncbi:hypothetical protein [Legionella fairfieldensis]|uniref:hypothetical protein n=1 Tax=Legionella fairfieldensis TaxID=45064 RepID=UPI00048E3B4D|nr:hypothetical protein [Legionella fairfieldensis]
MNLIHFDKTKHPIYPPSEIEWVYVYQVIEGTQLFFPHEQHPKTVIKVEHNSDGVSVLENEDLNRFRFNTYSKVPWYNVMDADCPPGMKDGCFISMNRVAVIA